MTNLDSKFIEKELVKYVNVGDDEWTFLTVTQVDVDDKHLTCIIGLSVTEESFKNRVLRVSIGDKKDKFAENRPGTSYFNDLLEEVRDDANEQVEAWSGDDLSTLLEDMFFDAVYMRCSELNSTGDLGFTEDEMAELTVSVVLDSVNRVTLTDADVLAYHEEIKTNSKTGKLEDWMVDSIDFSLVEDKEYDALYDVEVETRGLEVGFYGSYMVKESVNLNNYSISEVRDNYFSVWTDSERWNEFTNPATESGRVAELAELLASNASEDFLESDSYEGFPVSEVVRDILATIRRAVEENNEDYSEYGESAFEDVINLDELEKVEVYQDGYDTEYWDVITADNLLDWRNDYVDSREADNWETWERADEED